MGAPRVITDPDLCRDVWRQATSDGVLADLWEFRERFSAQYRRPLCFLVHEGARGIDGFLPLCWVEEAGSYSYFPGETWHGRTWIEQNRILAQDAGILCELIESCPGPFDLRYLCPPAEALHAAWTVDEIGYLFAPPKYHFDMTRYFDEFSPKTARKLTREVDAIMRKGVEFCLDAISDFDLLVELNLDRFGTDSYFADPRFLEGLRGVVGLLSERGWLRMTKVVVNGEVAAVDLGCVYRGVYTLLAGGTHPNHRGVAKLINLHHMERACRERLEEVDFLCGDFCWKTLFHLTPRPLYTLSSPVTTSVDPTRDDARSPAVV